MQYNCYMNKNQQIAQTLHETIERHSSMRCRTFEIKVVSNKLNREQKETISGIFREAKWIRNALISDMDCLKGNFRSVSVKVGDHFEERQLQYIGSQIKQSVVKQVHSELKGLKTHKQNGDKTGKLRYKSYCNSVNLKQYKVTYSILWDKNRIKIQGIKKPLYVRGLKQIPADAEIANGRLVRKASGLYVYITCFTEKEAPAHTGHMVGIDFGIEHNLTFSDGRTADICVPESKGVKLASIRVNRGLKHNGNNKKAENHQKRKYRLRIAYERDSRRRKDQADKTVHELLESNDFIAIQDEMIQQWHAGIFGKQVQHSAMGTVKGKLKNSSKVRMIERSYPSTQVCPVCGKLTKHPLSQREYQCMHCGYHHDSRDQKAAQSILAEAIRQVSVERRAQSPVEDGSTAVMPLGIICKNPPVKQEACDFSHR